MNSKSAAERWLRWNVEEERSIHRVRVQTQSQMVTLPWESAQGFVARRIAVYPTTHRLVDHFRAVGTSRPVDLTDAGDRDFALAVVDAWAADEGEDQLPAGIAELRSALRSDAN